MTVLGRALVRWAHGVVVDRTLRVTRGLPGPVAQDRFDQIVSDLWEQEHAPASGTGTLLAGSILLRALRGVPADLAWRRHALAEAAATPPAPVPPRIPLQADAHLFDQTNGAVDLESDPAPVDDGAEVRGLLLKGVASSAAFGFLGGGSGL